MFSYLVSVSYDGSDFFGWAKQPNKITVQGTIESLLSRVFKQKITIESFSRLDRGVHALDQKFVFKLSFFFFEIYLFDLLSKIFKKSIRVQFVKEIKKEINFFSNQIQKEYRYFINTKGFCLWNYRYCWEYNKHVLIKDLYEILSVFIGKHDFFNFCFCKEKDRIKKDTVRSIDFIDVKKKDNLIIIIFKGKGFLRYQIRAIIGESIKCYEKKIKINDLKNMLDVNQNFSKNRKYRYLAPSSGLFLWKIDLKEQ